MPSNRPRPNLPFTSARRGMRRPAARWPLAAVGATALCVGAFTVSVAHGATDHPHHDLRVKPPAHARSFMIFKGTFSNGNNASGVCLDFTKLKFDKDFALTGLKLKNGSELHAFALGVPCGKPPALTLGQITTLVPQDMSKIFLLDMTKPGGVPDGDLPDGDGSDGDGSGGDGSGGDAPSPTPTPTPGATPKTTPKTTPTPTTTPTSTPTPTPGA